MTDHQWIAPGVHGFLTGENLYLRPLELADARVPGAWHFSPYAITPQRAEEVLKQDLPKEVDQRKHRLVACRRSDDLPVAAVAYSNAWGALTMFVQLHADPTLGAEAAAVKGEMLRIVVPWMWQELHNMAVAVELDRPEPELIAVAASLGLRPAVRLREAVWQHGARHDRWIYELLHPAWVEKLGDPGPGLDGAGEARPLSGNPPPSGAPGSRRMSRQQPVGPIPRNAILVGDRIALRLMEPDDWKTISPMLRRETETFFDRGRWLPSPLVASHSLTEAAKTDPPTWINLGVVLRETGNLIGEVSLHGVNHFDRTAETGSMIYPPELRGQGLGSEAKSLLLEYAFDHLNLHMLASYVWEPNTRSQAALRKQGYRDAGRFRWESTTGADFVDSLVFDLLASEWRQRVNRPEGQNEPS